MPLPRGQIIGDVFGPFEILGLAGDVVELEGSLEERRRRLLVDAIGVEGPGRGEAVADEFVDIEGVGLFRPLEVSGLVGGPEGGDEGRNEKGADRSLGIDDLALARPGLADAPVGPHWLQGEIADAEGPAARYSGFVRPQRAARSKASK